MKQVYFRSEVQFNTRDGVFCPYCGVKYTAVPERVGHESYIRLVVEPETATEFARRHLYCVHAGQIWFRLEDGLPEAEIQEIIEEGTVLTTSFHDLRYE
jgi:uncharacterized protein YbaR (Trm112 family)